MKAVIYFTALILTLSSQIVNARSLIYTFEGTIDSTSFFSYEGGVQTPTLTENEFRSAFGWGVDDLYTVTLTIDYDQVVRDFGTYSNLAGLPVISASTEVPAGGFVSEMFTDQEHTDIFIIQRSNSWELYSGFASSGFLPQQINTGEFVRYGALEASGPVSGIRLSPNPTELIPTTGTYSVTSSEPTQFVTIHETCVTGPCDFTATVSSDPNMSGDYLSYRGNLTRFSAELEPARPAVIPLPAPIMMLSAGLMALGLGAARRSRQRP